MTTGSVIVGSSESGLIVRPAEETVTRPILLPLSSVNQRLPSGPAVISTGVLPGVGIAYSAMMPAGVIRPIRLALLSVNQRLPSGPAVISTGSLLGIGPLMVVGIAYSAMVPVGRRVPDGMVEF